MSHFVERVVSAGVRIIRERRHEVLLRQLREALELARAHELSKLRHEDTASRNFQKVSCPRRVLHPRGSYSTKLGGAVKTQVRRRARRVAAHYLRTHWSDENIRGDYLPTADPYSYD